MNIIITRFDPLVGAPTEYGAQLSHELTDSWDGVTALLAARGIDLPAIRLQEFHAESPEKSITFARRELVTECGQAYVAQVAYEITVA